MNRPRRLLLTAAAAAPWAVRARADAHRPLRVVASFSILADLVRVVGSADVDVRSLIGPDGDAHGYEPRPSDARALADADLVVVNGLGYEGWIDRLVAVSGTRAPVVVASTGIETRRVGPYVDPHAWQDPLRARRYVENLRDALSRARPARSADFAARAGRYAVELGALDQRVRSQLATVPPALRRVITTHDAFGYFALAYGLEFIAAQGISTGSEPSAAEVARLIGQIRSAAVGAVFVENIVDPRLIERIAREGRASVGGRLYSDALSPPGTEADTYLRLIAHNADTLVAALHRTAAGRP